MANTNVYRSEEAYGTLLFYPQFWGVPHPSLRRRSQSHHGIPLGLRLKEDYAFLILLWEFYGVRLD